MNEIKKLIKKLEKKKWLKKLQNKKTLKKTKPANQEKISSEFLPKEIKEKIKEFDFVLKENNSSRKAEELIKLYFAAGISLGLISIGISSFIELNTSYTLLLFFFCLLLPGLIHYFLHLFLFESNKKEKENLVPDILLQASIFPKGTSMLKIIKYVSESDYGLMGKEFEKAFNETEKGKTIEEALKGISLRCKSEIISRSINLLIQGNKSGCEMNKIFKETAEDILETQSIIRERIASLFIQKYTLILAGGIIVPALLGIITGFVNEMNFMGINELGLGMEPQIRKELISTSLIANQIYILEYALIASFFIAQQEGQTKKALVYALILIPLGIICYNIALVL
ncbi:type II secretion system F family protein [Candidatus Micrarchaeota archaeon]|nr:type II secretion system F family protein [Candidatus Micrarchaeota archaeon]MBU2476729.1 type II secretion system F family protein [Candidatus Micrarchaeota archaeon]